MPSTITQPHRSGYDWTVRHLAVLLIANFGLALGAMLVRLADTGPVAAGFWRLVLAFPVIFALSMREPLAQRRVAGAALLVVLGGGIAFGLDLAAWHIGIERTKLGNASLFGNGGGVILMAWGLIAARRAPRLLELTAILASLAGAALLMGGSLEISRGNLVGDLLCLLAGLLYAIYILMLGSVRERIGNYSLLLYSMLTSVPVMLGIAWLQGEAIMPHDWRPLLVLAVTSQLVGQGGLIYALRHFPPLVIGLALLAQPAIAALAGWLVFGETLSSGDVIGMILLAGALALAKADGK
ncbi:Threonine/homoserine efflux transporter RhtA [Novosphingobium sp. CF614]|uniref:DMT family transporter n=1 Tax=Novosphingobium sp. CF614 TaxID=1884364 RepID=UPI0008E3C03C|nr:DMT family transporter [Novosphingobium sp. CF614]SFF87271.1 Threonine/homoserine efflux transporter RhtA [Novosphingobium sp. CF614]